MKRMLGIVFSMVFTTFATAAYTQSIDIPQVPSSVRSTDNAEATLNTTNHDNTGDYQNQIMNDPNLNDRARAEAAMNSGNNEADMEGVGSNMNAARGNRAVIIQHGKANTSSIVQKGDNNSASQTQMGDHNDLTVEQTGNNNHSVENQKGSYNHKVKIQNGKKTEETTTDESDPQQIRE